MRAAGEQAIQDSAAGVSSAAADNEQPATSNVAGARGHPRAVTSSAASAAGGCPMDVDPELEVDYSGESEFPSDSKSPAKPSHNTAGAETTNAVPRGNLELHREMFGSSDESEQSSRGSNRSLSHSLNCTDYLESQVYLASRGESPQGGLPP